MSSDSRPSETTLRICSAAPYLLAGGLFGILLVAAAALTAGAVVAGIVVYAALAAALAVAWLGWLVSVGLLRGGDLGVRVLRRAAPPAITRAAITATGFPRIVAGSAGRPITPSVQAGSVRSSAAVDAAHSCQPRCWGPRPRWLPSARGATVRCWRGRVLTDIVVPVFGPASAGKTRLVFAGRVTLNQHMKAIGGALRPMGTESEATFRRAVDVIGSQVQTAKTDAGAPPAGITVRLAHAHRPSTMRRGSCSCSTRSRFPPSPTSSSARWHPCSRPPRPRGCTPRSPIRSR